MRALAVEILRTAAVVAGLPADAVMDAPDKDAVTLPKRRVECSALTEQYVRSGRAVGKFATPGKEQTFRTLRRARYDVRLVVRAVIRADDEAWLAAFAEAFLLALPKRGVDARGNRVTVSVDKAEYGGFTRRMVEAFTKRSKTFHVTFTGMATRDSDIPLIRDVTFTPTYREANNGQE